MNTALFFNQAGGSMATVATPTFFPVPGNYNVYPNSSKTITLSCATPSSHLFYTKDGTAPAHSADAPTGTTFRIGASVGSVNLPSSATGLDTTVIVLGYLAGSTDSPATGGTYTIERDSGA